MSNNMTFREFMRCDENFKTFLKSVPLTAAILGANYLAGGPLNKAVEAIVDKLSPTDYISKKTVIPYKIIRDSQMNPSKWDADYQNLQSPTSDMGYATHKDAFNKPVTLYVLKDEKLKEISPTALALAGGDSILLSDKLFTKLPTKYTDGELNPKGVAALSHELRHVTQNFSAVPVNLRQRQDANFKAFYKHYMNDPQEVGVRVAAIKNLLHKETIKDALKNVNLADDLKYFLLENLPEEKILLYNLVFPDVWAKKLSDKYAQQQPNIFKNVSFEHSFRMMIGKISDHLMSLNPDADSLLKFINSLSEEEKQNFLQKMIDIYDQVALKSDFLPKTAV